MLKGRIGPWGEEIQNHKGDHDALVLGLIFWWILSFPLYGPLGQMVLGGRAVLMGHVFAVSHSLGMVGLGLMTGVLKRGGRLNKVWGLLILAATVVVSFVPHPVLVVFSSLIMGLGAAFLVLAFVPRLPPRSDVVLTLGLAMALANLGLSLVQTAHGISGVAARFMAAGLGFMPCLAALLMQEGPGLEEEGQSAKGQEGLYYLVLMGACAYLCGGVWYRVLAPVFASHFGTLAGIDSLVYAVWVVSLAFYFNQRNLEDLGASAVGLLGLSFCLALAFREETKVF